jgi:hypothetical protein
MIAPRGKYKGGYDHPPAHFSLEHMPEQAVLTIRNRLIRTGNEWVLGEEKISSIGF